MLSFDVPQALQKIEGVLENSRLDPIAHYPKKKSAHYYKRKKKEYFTPYNQGIISM